ncbi:lytic transglycosylase domain-containing protein [Streptococcus chenjunshii]|uniref:Lytic transglycosylase domain-containing protein n=1 Tax=Streptococcus chenjunshii TaxID=2173853 RepID=A0A372KNG5_9STRE|nr:transglycosylase SLT domain-containing protein [Streptococcus chenjunshii]AXQ79795.1 lytic transglycosylase domain-containing protein [Streptococcus chenjunshii]RFU51064.1 lytic transglycosylase domain-containing protein [Streptococcus chenjunshii]RFU53108.1 lytic transglycosylase domain-containing protein [Streptococcus chenjunshii]
MYSRLEEAKRQKKRYLILGALLILGSAAGTAFAFTKTEASYTTATRQNAAAVSSEALVAASSSATEEERQDAAETSEDHQDIDPVDMEEEAVSELELGSEAYTAETADAVSADTAAAPVSGLTNGNTAGAVGSEAAAQMAAATGVPQSTWEYIIARESNGDYTVTNTSGASGLFQTMPGWGSTATVQDQINSAINAYNAQGLSAWGY